MIVSGCVRSPDLEIGDLLTAELQDHEKQGVAEVDFDGFIAGNWTRLVVVCLDVTNGALDEALGFTWKTAPDLQDSNFYGMLIFATESTVESHYSIGQNDFFEDWYFIPCTPPVDGDLRLSNPIRLGRAESKIVFVFNHDVESHPFWYVPAEEMQELIDRL